MGLLTKSKVFFFSNMIIFCYFAFFYRIHRASFVGRIRLKSETRLAQLKNSTLTILTNDLSNSLILSVTVSLPRSLSLFLFFLPCFIVFFVARFDFRFSFFFCNSFGLEKGHDLHTGLRRGCSARVDGLYLLEISFCFTFTQLFCESDFLPFSSALSL